MKKNTSQIHLIYSVNIKLLFSCLIFICFSNVVFGQQNVFSRDNSNTGDWGSGNLPWFYTSGGNQGDPDNNNTVRNFVKIGHNNNTTMTTNGRFYQVNTLDFEVGASAVRTINNSSGGLSVSGGIYNASVATHIINTPLGIDGSLVQLHTNSSGGLTFSSTIFINANTVQFGNLGAGAITVSGSMEGSGQVQKVGSNTLLLTGVNIYTGSTTISGGTLQLNSVGNAVPSTNNITVNGGTLRISSNQTLTNLTLTSGGLTVDSGVTLTLTDVTIPADFVLTNDGTIVINGTLTDNRTTKTYTGTIQYSGADQSVVAGTYNNLSILNTGTKTFAGDASISGDFVVTDATVVAPNTLIFNGGSTQNIAGLSYNNIEFSGVGSKTFTSNASIGSTNAITFDGSVATVDFDGTANDLSFILKSDANGTARVGNATTWTLNGKVTVERYIPAKRAWRLLTAPLTGDTNNSLFYNWQNNGAAGDGTTGLLLWSPSGTANPTASNTGLFQGPQANARTYVSGAFQNVANSNSTLLFTATENNPFLIFVTGPHASSNITTTAATTTAKATGKLITGTVNHSLIANQFKLIGNPYASAINPQTLITTNSGAKLWMIDPTNGLGAYVTYDGNWSIEPANAADGYIQSGQAFFAKTASASTFEINEDHKVIGNSNNWFERNANDDAVTESIDKIRVLLYKQIDSNWTIADGILAVNQLSGSNEVTDKDAGKISNFNESLMFRNNTSNLSIEYRALPQMGDIQNLRLTGTTAIPYQLRLYTQEYTNSNLQPYLEDTVSGTLTAIPVDGTEVVVPFTGVASSSTNPDNRFRIVYQTNLSTVDNNKLVASVFPNPVVNNQLNVNLGQDAVNAEYTITNLLGQSIQKGILANTQNLLTLSSASQGFYILNIRHDGKSFTTKIYVQ